MAAWSLRFDFQPDFAQVRPVLALAIFVILGQLVLGHAFQLYRGRYRVGSIDEVSGVTLTVLILATLATLCVLVFRPAGVPRSIPAIAGALALGLMLSGRVALRLYRMRFVGTDVGARTLVYGAGHTGEHLVRLMLSDPSKTFHPVGVLDDDSEKQQLRSYGVRVLGKNKDLERIVEETGATVLVVAMTRISAAQLRDLDRRCQVLAVELRVIPTGNQLLTEGVQLGDLSSVTVEDLLGRRPIEATEVGISELLRGKRVLITGAGGSIGSELSRQVARYDPAFLGILDRDESAIQAVQMSLHGHGLLGDENLLLADIRDASRLVEIFNQVRPDIVFHAAALKHLSLLEAYPGEAFKTNIIGTQNVLAASVAAGVQTFVNISTDKAADPSSVLGMSKLVTERLTATAGPGSPHRYLSVRFGNVLGSRGSVLNLFREQIAAGGPVTVTDPDVTRYFMTVGEAVHLVLQAAVIGDSATTLILDMGTPVRISDVARQLIDVSGRDIKIAYVGLRPAEKLHEALVSAAEKPEPTGHALITQVRVERISIEDVRQVHDESGDAYQSMARLVGADFSAGDAANVV
jgi:FlaA1/EpsC-like NDP-sugar epimerase